MARDPGAPARGNLALLAFAALAWMVAIAHFLWLGLEFVPTQAKVFARIGVELPPYVRLVHLTPHHVRPLPAAVLAGPFVGLLVLWAVVRVRGLRWRSVAVVRTAAVLALAATSVTVLASFAVVQATLAAYQRIVTEPRFQRR